MRQISGTFTADLDPSALRGAGVETLVLAEPVPFDVSFVRFLREAMSHTLRVNWTTDRMPAIDPDLVNHLQPPAPAAHDEVSTAWRSRYAYGRCYYRRGPGFVTVKDTRVPDANARYLIDDPDAVEAFAASERVVHLPSAPEPLRELLDLLFGERLALRLGEYATLLPNRMRGWPVPYNAV